MIKKHKLKLQIVVGLVVFILSCFSIFGGELTFYIAMFLLSAAGIALAIYSVVELVIEGESDE